MRVAAGQVGNDLDRLSLWDENTQSLERRGVDAAAREGERAEQVITPSGRGNARMTSMRKIVSARRRNQHASRVCSPRNTERRTAARHPSRGFTGKCLFLRCSGTRFVCSISIFPAAGVERVVGFAALCRAAHVNGGVGERDAGFGHADEFDRLLRGDGDEQPVRISQADVFAGGNDEAPRDETRVLAGMQHFREPVDRGFFVRSADAFDERADCIVVRIAGAIVDDRLFVECFPRQLRA